MGAQKKKPGKRKRLMEGNGLAVEKMDVEELFDAIGSLMDKEEASKDQEQKDKNGEEIEVSPEEDGEDAGQDESSDQDPNQADEEDEEDEDTMEAHQKQLEELKKSDPEFYEYLKENDEDLLAFGEDDEEEEEAGDVDDADEEDMDSDEDEQMEEEEEEEVEDDKSDEESGAASSLLEPEVLSMDGVKLLEERMSKRPREAFAAAKKLLAAFRSGAYLTESTKQKKKKRKASADGQAEEEKDSGIGDGETFGGEVRFSTPRVYQRLMTVSVVKLLGFLASSAGRKEGSRPTWKPDSSSSRWKKVQPMIRSFSSSFIHLLENVQDGGTTRFLLKRAEVLIPLLTPMPKRARELMSTTIGIWASDSSGTPTKLRAYLLMHSACSNLTEDYLEVTLKKSIAAYREEIGQKCNLRQLPSITFAVKCISELCGIDLSKAYTAAFVNIREIAVALRVALLSKGKTELGQVYNWEVINSIKLWSCVLSMYYKDEELKPLIYPFAQVTTGLMRLVPSPKNYGLRFLCARYLIEVMSTSGVYIPVGPALLEALSCKEVVKGKLGDGNGARSKKRRKEEPKASTKELDWRFILRVPEASLKTRNFRDGVVKQCMLLLSLFLSKLSRSVAFPEVSYPTLAALRRFAKEVNMTMYSKTARKLLRAAEDNKRTVLALRAKLNFGAREVADYSCAESPLKFPGENTPMEKLSLELLAEEEKQIQLFDEAAPREDGPASGGADEESSDSDEEVDESKREMEEAADRPILLKENRGGRDGDQDDDEDVVEDLDLSDDDSADHVDESMDGEEDTDEDEDEE